MHVTQFTLFFPPPPPHTHTHPPLSFSPFSFVTLSTSLPPRTHHARRDVHAPTDAYAQKPDILGAEDARWKELEAKDRRIAELESIASFLKESTRSKRIKEARNTTLGDEGWKRELELKNRRIAELEVELIACKSARENGVACTESPKLLEELKEEKESWRREREAKNRRIAQLEDEIERLKRMLMEDAEASRSKRCKDGETKTQEESWKQEIEAKNRRIVELEQEMESLENFLKDHADTESVRELEMMVQRKSKRIEELEDTVAEFEDFLKQNPDVKDLHELRCQVTAGNRRIQELERWIQKKSECREVRIDRERVIELEEMVTQLEEYVREHNVDGLKRKLQDRECRIDQLQERIGCLEKELLRVKEKCEGKEKQQSKRNVEDKGTATKPEDFPCDRLIGDENSELREKNRQKMTKMEHAISEKDNKIQAYEQQIVESEDEISKLRKEMAALRKELSEYDDIGVLKEEIRVRDERIQQLEDEVDSLEKAFSERIDLEQIEELVNVIKEKDETERKLSEELMEKRDKIEELSEALRESVVIVSDSEKQLKNEEKTKKDALERVSKLEQRIVSMQTASALKCITCQPLLSKLQKYETKLEQLTKERTVQLEDLRQVKREALKAALSEKDAHLALLELPGFKSAAQSEQADQLKADRTRLLEKLKKEDEKCIELSVEYNTTGSGQTPQLLAKVLETTDDNDEETSGNHRNDSNSPKPVTSNGDVSANPERKTSKGAESRNEQQDEPKTNQQDSR